MAQTLPTEVSDNIMLGFSYMEAYAKNDKTQEQLFESTYTETELKNALLLAYDQTMWAYALAKHMSVEEYLGQMRDYLSNFTETIRVVEEDES